MKLKRTKLAALAMSALMAVSAFSPYVYAEESTEAATEVATEATSEEVAEEAVEEVAVASLEDETEESDAPALTTNAEYNFDITVSYLYEDDDNPDVVTGFTATVTATNSSSGKVVDTKTITSAGTKTNDTYGITYTTTFTAPTCVKAGSLKIVASYTSHTAGDKKVEYTYSDDGTKDSTSELANLLDHVLYDNTSLACRYVRIVNGQVEVLTASEKAALSCSDTINVQYQIWCSLENEWMGTWGYGGVEGAYGTLDASPHVCTSTTTKTAVVIVPTSGDDFSNLSYSSTQIATANDSEVVDDEGYQIMGEYDWAGAGTISGKVYKATIDSTTGEPKLVNSTETGYYFWMYTCASCGEVVYEAATVNATKAAYVQIVDDDDDFSASSNIKAFWIYDTAISGTTTKADEHARYLFDDATTLKFSTDKTESTIQYPTLPENDLVELKDCTKDGYYYIEYYSADGVRLGKEKVTVTKHHMEIEVAAFSSQEDMDACTVEYDSTGALVVESTSCYYSVKYTKVVECYAECCSVTSCDHDYEKHVEKNDETNSQIWNGIWNNQVVNKCTFGEISSTSATAEPTGPHTWLKDVETALKNEIAAEKKAGYKVTVDTVDEVLKDLLEDKAAAENKDSDYYYAYAEITKDTSTCTTTGEVTVTFYCTTHPAGTVVVDEWTVSVDAAGHIDLGYQVVENLVDATCTSEGSYDLTHKCQREGCTYEFEDTVSKTIPRLKHSNEEAPYDPNAEDYEDDTDNSLGASTIYIEFVGDRVVDKSADLLELYNAGITTFSSSNSNDTWVASLGISTGRNVFLTGSNYSYVVTTAANKIINLIGGAGLSDTTLGVQVRVYTKCTECGYEVDLTSDYLKNTGSGLSVTIDDIQAQDSNGAGGYVTLSINYDSSSATVVGATTATFNYYTSSAAYNGRVDKDTAYDPDVTTKNGLCLDDDGVYRYYQGGEFASDFAGVVNYDGGTFFVANGLICTDATGLNLYNGTWYMLVNGQVQTQYTGVCIYDNEVFYITDGILDTTVTGLKEYDGAQFLFCYGRLMSEVSGLWYYDSAIGGDDTFYYLAYGQVVNYSGAVIYDNTFFLVENGKLSTYTGVYTYDGATFNVINGEFVSQVA